MKSTEIATLLPSIFQRTLGDASPMSALLAAMEVLHAPTEDALSQIDAVYDPRRTGDDFVAMLAQWVDMDRILSGSDQPERLISTGLGNLRELVRAAAEISKWRGTRRGLKKFLETATGTIGFEIEEPADKTFHVRVLAPESTKAHEALMRQIIEVERPIYATWNLEFMAPQP